VPIAVVCDGLGGQEGGEIASKLTIDALTEKLNQLQFEQKKWRPESNFNELEKMIRQVNDQISDRNDLEKRKERQRMGTTIVMAVARAHEIYLTHVGDSRMYLITKNGAYQLTVDDDVAARETRLGYALYRQALQFPNCGALTQALGMASSHGLHINRKCLILDEECILLLCSDGLSDFDRVEQYWENKILPILTQGISLATVGNQLVKIANEKNGHDNVTVAILHCQVIQKKTPQNLLWAQIKSNFPTVPPEDSSGDISNSEMPTIPMGSVPVKAYTTKPPQDSTSVENSPEQNNSTQSTPSKVNPFILGILGAAILAGLSYFLWSLFFSQSNPDNSQPNQPQTYQTE